ncbi:hypothetical protein BH24ACI3_BH24ACI3_10250 [soil metagenome]
MERNILIIDDHDDLASSLQEVFSHLGHTVEVLKNWADAVRRDDVESFDLVITDLDFKFFSAVTPHDQNGAECLPEMPTDLSSGHSKVFKICATNFRRDEFNEEQLKEMVATILDYKISHVDKCSIVQDLHEYIEFELPSGLSLMHVVLDYLMKRVEKLGVINPEKSNLFIALDEAFVNAVKHGNKYDAQKLVRISAEVSAKEARFTIEDEGEGFDVKNIPDPLDPQNLFKTSGRGVLFIYNIMDEVAYNDRGNRLTMVKKSESEI